MDKSKYKIIGRSGAGSLIAEFLLSEAGVEYEITFTDLKNLNSENSLLAHPQGKIPILICPNQSIIFETLAIVNHLTDRFNILAPKRGSYLYDRYWQFLSLMATSIYSAYHRQHHSRYYAGKEYFEDLRSRSHKEQLVLYDYIEKELAPFICGDFMTAADFYLYMLMRWDLHKEILYRDRPKLRSLSELMRKRTSVIKVLENQPKRKNKGSRHSEDKSWL